MAALDARFLIDIHFRQGGKKDKDSFPLPHQPEAKEHVPDHQSTIPTEQWHRDEELIGGYDHDQKDKR